MDKESVASKLQVTCQRSLGVDKEEAREEGTDEQAGRHDNDKLTAEVLRKATRSDEVSQSAIPEGTDARELPAEQAGPEQAVGPDAWPSMRARQEGLGQTLAEEKLSEK